MIFAGLFCALRDQFEKKTAECHQINKTHLEAGKISIHLNEAFRIFGVCESLHDISFFVSCPRIQFAVKLNVISNTNSCT